MGIARGVAQKKHPIHLGGGNLRYTSLNENRGRNRLHNCMFLRSPGDVLRVICGGCVGSGSCVGTKNRGGREKSSNSEPLKARELYLQKDGSRANSQL